MLAKLAWRTIWRNKRRTLITLTTISLALTFGIFFIAWGDGMYGQIIQDAVRMQAGNVTLQHPEYKAAPAVDLYLEDPTDVRAEIEAMPEVAVTKLLVIGQGIARTSHDTAGIEIYGVEPANERKLSRIPDTLLEEGGGAYLAPDDGNTIMLGWKLADNLEVEVGDKVVISTNDATGELRDELFRVKGIFRSGSDEFDAYMVQIPIDAARNLYALPETGAHRLGVILHDSDDEDAIAARINAMTRESRMRAYLWPEILPELYTFMTLDQGGNYVFQFILMLLILFTIFNTLLMSVMERQREFAVLLALGTTPSRIRRQVMIESVYLGLIASAIGCALGAAISLWTAHTGIDLTGLMDEGNMTITGFFWNPIIHPKITLRTLLLFGGFAFLATVLLGTLPARRAIKVNITDIMR